MKHFAFHIRHIASSAALTFALLAALTSCSNAKKGTASTAQPVGPTFLADSAMHFCRQQCDFGPRPMNSPAHDECCQWIADKFRQYGMSVSLQQATLNGYDGTPLQATNIVAAYRPQLTDRIMLCAHWDSRPWADNDPAPENWRTPILAANDAASGVAVMLEVARLLCDSAATHSPSPTLGVDFICFDAEDWGTPQWADDVHPDSDPWALGAQYWAAHPHTPGYQARFGILLDMVGGQGARFFREGMSVEYAPDVVRKVWSAARTAGYGSYFPNRDGGMITDDHVPVNQVARIPCIDIIPYYPDCPASSFGPTWHTLSDDLSHLDPATLQAVGQTLVQVIYSEQ